MPAEQRGQLQQQAGTEYEDMTKAQLEGELAARGYDKDMIERTDDKPGEPRKKDLIYWLQQDDLTI